MNGSNGSLCTTVARESSTKIVYSVTERCNCRYNNQWIIVDYKLFNPGQPLQPGTLWIAEQIPGYVIRYFSLFDVIPYTTNFESGNSVRTSLFYYYEVILTLHSADMTATLHSTGYWASYNIVSQ
jgi:hypothetical protein